MLGHRSCSRERRSPRRSLSLHCPKDQRGTAFLEKTDTWLAHASYFMQTTTRLIGVGKGSSYQSNLVLAVHESQNPTQISVPSHFGKPESKVRGLALPGVSWDQGRCSCKLSGSTKCRLSRETILQGLNSLKTISQSLLINPNIAMTFLKCLS